MNKYWNLISKKINLKDFSPEKLKNELDKIEINDISIFYKDLENKYIKKENLYYKFNLKEINKLLDENLSFSSEFVEKINKSEAIKTILDEDSNHFVKDYNLLKSSIEGVFENGYYNNKLNELAVCWFRLIDNHPFSNGNKRTAFISIKINIIIDLISGILNNTIKLLNESFDKEIKKFIKNNHKNKNTKNISKNKSLQFKSNFINKIDKLIKIEFREFTEYLIEDISNIWTKEKSLSEDYILSVWIVSNINSLNYEELRDRVYEILRINLILFIVFNFGKMMKEIDAFTKKFLQKNKKEIINYLKKELKEFIK